MLCLVCMRALPCAAQTQTGGVDVFAGVDLQYRDIHFRRLYDVLLSITPGVRWQMAPGWEAAAQVHVPVYNTYGGHYGRVRLNIADVSWQHRWGRLALKTSAGVFSHDRYGMDVRTMYMATPWLALEGQAGFTGYARITAFGWEASPMQRVTGLGAAAVWLKPWSVEMRARGGRYAYGDWGCDGEVMRHFRHTTVGLRARWSRNFGAAFGFNVTVMLPPYRRSKRRVTVRPASAFVFNYTNRSGYLTNVIYDTDPEANVRQGWFAPQVAPWGLNAERPDFYATPKDSVQP